MTDNREKVAADFRNEISHAFEPGAKVMSADRELRYCLELQRDRLEKRNLRYKEEMIHRGPFPNGLSRVRSWKDGHYDTSWTVDFITHNRTIQRDGMKTYRKSVPQSIYETVVGVRDGEDVSGDRYSCPNCGSVSTIAELQEGCAHCGTHFEMSELYPKVKNYYFVFDMSGKAEKMFKTVVEYGLYLLPVNILMCLSVIAKTYGGLGALASPRVLFTALVTTVIMIPIIGYFGWFLDCFRRAFTVMPSLFEVIGSRTRFESHMSVISPEFTLEYFAAKMMSLFKIFVFSDKRAELPFYRGSGNGEEFDNIVDVASKGYIACKSVRATGNMVNVTADLYFENSRDLGNKIKTRDEVYRIKAGRRTDIPYENNFSITNIQCSSCGGSFDAFKSRTCPYCGTEYDQEKNDWVIYEMKNVGTLIRLRRLITGLLIVAVLVSSCLVTLNEAGVLDRISFF
ncbi:MAG: hypothetical protein J6Y12_06890 [Lachnospiraceae bacterium]|nr:hypothetical protein [Lachnospiraceae bacterium]